MFCAFWCVWCCSDLFGLCGGEYCSGGVRKVAGPDTSELRIHEQICLVCVVGVREVVGPDTSELQTHRQICLVCVVVSIVVAGYAR